jgi:hypothetical protein
MILFRSRGRTGRLAGAVLMLVTIVMSACASPGGTPAWVESPDTRYSEAAYLVGVGIGPDYNAAENDALAGISAIVFSDVDSTCDFTQMHEDSSETGVKSEERIVCQTAVGTRTELEGVQVVERGRSGGEFYALAVLEKSGATVSLRDRIRSIETGLGDASRRAAGATPLESAKILSAALAKANERDLLAAQYRVVAEKSWRYAPTTAALERQRAESIDAVLFVVEASNLLEETGERENNRSLAKGIADVIAQRGFALSRDDSGSLRVMASISLSGPYLRGKAQRAQYQWDAVVEIGANERNARAFIVEEESGSAAHPQADLAKKVAIEQAEDVLIRRFRDALDRYLTLAERAESAE